MNVGVGFSNAKQLATSRFVIRNAEGFILGSGFRVHNLVTTTITTEVIAALHGLQFASDMSFLQVWAGSFSGYRFEFTTHQGNFVAYALAEEGMRRLEDCFWVEDARMEAEELADVDR
ncbi:hypothetical protein GOBAR_DD00733 [Gossypium barbadense]|nr:hypothetical protein GOBAR_DD00733 [Gossypium barbadense]